MSKIHKEPLLTENPNRFVMFPIEHDDIWKSYKQIMFLVCLDILNVDIS